MEDEVKFSQADVDRIVSERLGREKLKLEELSNKYNLLNNDYVELVNKTKQYETQLAELPTLKRQAILNDVAREHKVPDKLVNRLSGNTREEIEADAKSLLAELAALSEDSYKGLPATPNGKGTPKREGINLLVSNIQKLP